MRDGLGSNKYRAVDYNEMMEKVLQKKLEANSSVIKMCKLKSLSKRQQKDTKIKQHQMMWRKEMLRLKDLRHIAEMDIAEHIVKNAKNGLPIYLDYDYLTEKQAEEMAIFKAETLEPIWNLWWVLFRGIDIYFLFFPFTYCCYLSESIHLFVAITNLFVAICCYHLLHFTHLFVAITYHNLFIYLLLSLISFLPFVAITYYILPIYLLLSLTTIYSFICCYH